MKQELLFLQNVFTPNETKEIVDKFKNVKNKMSVVGKANELQYLRIADGLWIMDTDYQLVERFKDIVVGITGIPKTHQENPHFVKYKVGGEYKPHYDSFHTLDPKLNPEAPNGGQRLFSCLLYLNDDFEGGETIFPIKNVSFKPKNGSILFWRDTDDNGNMAKNSLHAGLPVTKGTKYILVIWVREKPCPLNPLNSKPVKFEYKNVIKSKAIKKI